MMSTFTCDDKPTLIAYLYGEVDAATRRLVDAHLATCERCAAEVAALGDVRAELALWAPPDAELGFAITRKSEPQAAQVLRPARWWSTVPAWAQAAAAVLVIAAGAGIANLQVRSGPDGFSVSTGWLRPTAATVSAPAQENNEAWRTALVSLEQQLQRDRSAHEQNTVAPPHRVGDEATIRRCSSLPPGRAAGAHSPCGSRNSPSTRTCSVCRLAEDCPELRAVRRADPPSTPDVE